MVYIFKNKITVGSIYSVLKSILLRSMISKLISGCAWNMELDDWVLAAHFKKLAAEQLLERAIDLIHHEQNYDEAIRCLHRCLESAPAHEPFFGVHVTAIVHLGLAHIHRNEFEEAIAQLAMIPHGISMQMQHIPLVSMIVLVHFLYQR